MTTLAALFLDTHTHTDPDTDVRSGIMFVTSGAHGVLVEGVRPGHDPIRAAISPTDAVDVLDALWAGRAIDLPAIDGITGIRRLQFRPRPDGVEVSIRSRTSTRGRWLVHADRVPELGDALRRALAAARAATDTAMGGSVAEVSRDDVGSAADLGTDVRAGSSALAAALQVIPGGRR
ncbi:MULTISPECIES: hypothetical protein [Actinoalloteichus]|uniref:Uncharacterized protein n=1 Tax=Actinoalloteichus fjordicus TaxID=1612552 RepID=A0AAC9PSY2_9PSEU|nr:MULTISPECIES: hypothetical protein [Actinoalloteichus]APU16069.1 hypothetical protein UA74_20220 [Actinoalloteichus fjordicus]APU22134.1 hypothetical protein UA75_20725 [Actinoalloteichus sp. GBA129-24]